MLVRDLCQPPALQKSQSGTETDHETSSPEYNMDGLGEESCPDRTVGYHGDPAQENGMSFRDSPRRDAGFRLPLPSFPLPRIFPHDEVRPQASWAPFSSRQYRHRDDGAGPIPTTTTTAYSFGSNVTRNRRSPGLGPEPPHSMPPPLPQRSSKWTWPSPEFSVLPRIRDREEDTVATSAATDGDTPSVSRGLLAVDHCRVENKDDEDSKGDSSQHGCDADRRAKAGDMHLSNQKESPKSAAGESDTRKPEFSCPFYARSPELYFSVRGCRSSGWHDVHRLKEHLYRHHLHVVCHRCSTKLPSLGELRKHLRQAVSCPLSAKEAPEYLGFDVEVEKQLRSRKSTKDMTEENKWNQTFILLFPSFRNKKLPNPYLEYNPAVHALADDALDSPATDSERQHTPSSSCPGSSTRSSKQTSSSRRAPSPTLTSMLPSKVRKLSKKRP